MSYDTSQNATATNYPVNEPERVPLWQQLEAVQMLTQRHDTILEEMTQHLRVLVSRIESLESEVSSKGVRR